MSPSVSTKTKDMFGRKVRVRPTRLDARSERFHDDQLLRPMFSTLRISTRSRLLVLSRPCYIHRTYASQSASRVKLEAELPKLQLPDHDNWRELFPVSTPIVRDRVTLANPATAKRLAKSFLTGKAAGAGTEKIVIEAFPGAVSFDRTITEHFLRSKTGPGCLSRALLDLPSSQLKKLIILEDYEPYLEYLRVRLHFFESDNTYR